MKIQSLLALLLALIFTFMPLTVCAVGNDDVLQKVYESNLRLSTYGEGKYTPLFFTVANNGEEYAELNKKAREIISGCTSDKEKAHAINTWVAENIYFDYDNFSHSKPRPSCDAVDVFKSRVTVCEGYAALMNAMCRAVGVPCRQILGQIVTSNSYFLPYETAPLLNEGGHAWVEIYVDGKWFMCDPTWDSRNVYEYGEKTYSPSVDKYFCSDIKSFSKEHYTIDYYDRIEIDGFSINPSIYGIKLCAYNKNISNVIIPENLGITVIHTRAFSDNTNIKSITIASTVESIGDNVFMNCKNLDTVTFNEGVREIGTLAFSNCSGIKSICLPSTLTSLGYGAFENCTSLKTVSIDNNIEKIGVLAFNGCINLDTVYYNGTKAEWDNIEINKGNDSLYNAKIIMNDCILTPEEQITIISCNHICHKSGFVNVIYKIMCIFWKLFGVNKYCSCGNVHY